MKQLSKLNSYKKKALFISLKLHSSNEKDFDAKKYNDVVENLNNFIEDQRSQMQNYFDGRSEKWQESDKGDAYQNWIDAWEIVIDKVKYFDDVDILNEEELPDEPI
jgi:hypothetical protein